MIPHTSIIISINDTHGCFCAAAGLSEGRAAAGDPVAIGVTE